MLERLAELTKGLEEVRRRQELMSLELGAIAESLYTRFLWDELLGEFKTIGKKVLEKKRNYRVDGEDIDLIVVTERSICC